MIKINAENLKLMTTVKIPGYGQSEGFREFEILTREDLEEKIDDLNISDVFRDTFEMANSYMHSGTAYSYLDARNGKIFTSWLGSNTFNHPWDSFYEIWLCDLKSGDQKIDLDTPEDILSNDEEWAAWREFDGSLEEFLGKEEYQVRFENAVDWEAEKFYLNHEDISHQLDDLYRKEYPPRPASAAIIGGRLESRR